MTEKSLQRHQLESELRVYDNAKWDETFKQLVTLLGGLEFLEACAVVTNVCRYLECKDKLRKIEEAEKNKA